MTTNDNTQTGPTATPAPFDPRRGERDERTPPPRPPSAWQEDLRPAPEGAAAAAEQEEPGFELPAPGDDEPVVLDDGEVPSAEAAAEAVDLATGASPVPGVRRRGSPRRVRRLVSPQEQAQRQAQYTPQQRLLILDTWQRSGLPAGDYAPLMGLSKHTLYAWKARFEADGPAGLVGGRRGRSPGSRLSEPVKRAILLMKTQNPDWGTERISDMLTRGPGFAASPGAVARVLKEAGHELCEVATRPHRDHVRRFERARPNQLWQSDLFTFVLKRQNQRVYLVAFLDDHSRYVVSIGLHASQSAAFVLEALRSGIANYGSPEEVLTDNGSQYVTWRGTSAFAAECQKRGIRHIVASPRHPQTLGKTERFWGTLWRECLESAVFSDLAEARTRIGHFVDHYNFQRPHQGIEGLVPADRFFAAAPTMRRTLTERVAANALGLAREGVPRPPFYLAGNVGGEAVSVHAQGDRLVLKAGERPAVEVQLGAAPACEAPRVDAHGPPPVATTPLGAASPAAVPPPAPATMPASVASVTSSPHSPWRGVEQERQPGTSPLDLFLDPQLPTAGGEA